MFQFEYFEGTNLKKGLELLTVASEKGNIFSTYALGMILLFGDSDAMVRGVDIISKLKRSAMIFEHDLIKCRKRFLKIAFRTKEGGPFVYGFKRHICPDYNHRFYNDMLRKFDYAEPNCECCLCDMEIDEL